jgi:hypothetical protein
MHTFGFMQEPPSPDPGIRVPPGHSRLYGLVDLDQARANGYYWDLGVSPPDPGTAPPELPAEWYAIAAGDIEQTASGQPVPRGGCRGEADRALHAGMPAGADLPLADRLAQEAFGRAEQDSRVQAAFAAWRSCMAAKGYDYSDPWGATNDVAWSATPSAQRPSEREALTATADVECKIEVDLVDIWASVHTAYERRAVEHNAQALALIQDYREAELANALAIINGDG